MEPKVDMPAERDSMGISVVNGKLYAIGGISGCDEPTSLVEEYNPATNKWTRKADMPTARLGLSTSVANGRIYAIGGATGRGQDCMWWSGVSTVEEYNPVADKWTTKSDMPTPRAFFSTCEANGKIYAIGGFSYGVFSTVEEYDPVTDTWIKKKDMPTLRCNFATASVNGKIYAVGGEAPTGFTPILEEYDPLKDEWTRKTDMPTPRSKIACSAVNDRLYIIGGCTSEASLAISVVEEYDPGFSDKITSVDAKGKLVTSWGEIKSKH